MQLDLPPGATLKLQQTLAQWRHWRCEKPPTQKPKPVELLGGGHSNINVLVAAGERFVVRIDSEAPSKHGLNRLCEWHTLQAAWAAELAPQPCYFNPELGSLVCAYIEPESTSDHAPAEIGRLLHAIHQLPARRHRLDLGERIKRYEQRLSNNDNAIVRAALASSAHVHVGALGISKRQDALVLCHADLLRANRIYNGGKLRAVDWEYCAMGSPWFDLAVVIEGDELDAAGAKLLLESYLGRPANEDDFAALTPHSLCYRYLELLWYLAHPRATMSDEFLAQKLAKLTVLRDEKF